MKPLEHHIRSVNDGDVYEATRGAFPTKTDAEVIAELMRSIVFVAISWNDIVEDGQNPVDVLNRRIFSECDDLASHFPWPD